MSETRDEGVGQNLEAKHSDLHGRHEVRTAPRRGEAPVRRFVQTKKALSVAVAALTFAIPLKSALDSSRSDESSRKVNQGIEQVEPHKKYITPENLQQRLNTRGEENKPPIVTTEKPAKLTPEQMVNLKMLGKKDPYEFFTVFPYLEVTPEVQQLVTEVVKANPGKYIYRADEMYTLLPAEAYEDLLVTAFVSDPTLVAQDTLKDLFGSIATNTKECDMINSLIGPHTGMLLENMMNDGLTEDEAEKILRDEQKLLTTLLEIKNKPNHLGAAAVENNLKNTGEFIAERMNTLHEADEATRFAVIEGYSAQNLFAVLAYSGDVIYTSTYNGTFDRLLKTMAAKDGSAQKLDGKALLSQFDDEQVRAFLKEAAGYDRLTDFLSTMEKDDAKDTLLLMVTDIEKTDHPLDQAVAAADFLGTGIDTETINTLKDQIVSEYERVSADPLTGADAKKIYGLLGSVLAQRADVTDQRVKDLSKEYPLPAMDVINPEEFFDSQNENIQQYYFYDDRGTGGLDGHNSFQHWLNAYGFSADIEADGKINPIPTSEKNGWKIVDNGTYIKLFSTNIGKSIVMYANKPTEQEVGVTDIQEALKKSNKKVTVGMHRGHSYYTHLTIDNLPVDIKIAILGSCGGYQNMDKIQNAVVVATKGTGTMEVNDVIAKMLNERLLAGKTFTWEDQWVDLQKQLKGNKEFEDYIRPDKNSGYAFLQGFRK